MTEFLGTLDWIVFALILLFTFVFVIYGNYRQAKVTESVSVIDHLIMGRKLTLPLFMATLVATWYGGIFGVTQIAFEKGIYNFITQGLFWYISYLIFAFFLVNKINAFKAVTLPDLIGKMFGPRSLKLAAVFNFFNVLPIAYIISLGLFIQVLTTFELNTSMLIGLACVLSYSTWGGFRSVVLSDLIQFFVMCAGVFFVLVFSVSQFGGLQFLQGQLPEKHFSPTSDVGYVPMFIWGFIALSTLVDPNFYQRCFAAQNPQTAKKGIIFSTLIWFGFDICTTVGAMYARAVIPEADSGQAYLTYAIQLLPAGLRGFFLAGILATILSTLDSYLFLAGTTLTYDLGPKNLRDNKVLHSLGILGVGLIGLILATTFEGNIKLVWKTLGSYSTGCFLFPVMFGYISKKKISDTTFVLSCLSAAIAMTLWRFLPREGFLAMWDELYIGVLVSFMVLLTFRASTKNS